jgi:uncharacterized cupredoxin-like copper-binding protein
MNLSHALVAIAVIATPLAACGGTDDDTAGSTAAGATTDRPSADGRTVTVTMTDNAFEPSELTVDPGETVTFELVNDGQVTHEAYLGSEEDQANHAAEMAGTDTEHSMDMGNDQMGDEHSGHGDMDDGHLVVVEPGERASLTETFDEPGTVVLGCHQPGHWESGMKATVTVS